RIHLLVWVGIAFLLPLLLVLALRLPLGPRGSVITVQSELPAKGLTAFFVVLATWIVSRLEKRPLSDYGAPPRQAFGKRFWEGSVWGFAMLSATLWAGLLHSLEWPSPRSLAFVVICSSLCPGAGASGRLR